MTISSRTPEGLPHLCPICGTAALIEASLQGDACCPACGQLLWWFRDRLQLSLTLESALRDELQLDSLDIVEVMMELEEEFGVVIPDEEAENFRTLADIIRYVRQRLEDSAGAD